MTPPTSLSSSYLPHLNGLRALAILGVLIYHLRASYCPAGYFGVDLFLVISGFLLLRGLLKPGTEQSFHYGSYLLKKAWRIIPSWFIVTIAACAATLTLLHPVRIVNILQTARYSCVFLADYQIDLSGNYFNVFAQQNPLLHFWYLSITQQLYLIAPLLVIPLMRWCSRRAAIILLVLLALLSLAYYVLTTAAAFVPETIRTPMLHAIGYQSTYYHLIPRFWEIVAGVGVLLLPEFGRFPKLRGTLGTLGLAGIVASFYLYDTGSPAIYLTIICSLLALRYANSGPAARILGLRPVQALGTISFSLYLWHWPIMLFWKYCRMDTPNLWDEIGMIAASLLMGTLGWFFIERIKTPSLAGWKGTLLRSSILVCLPLIIIGTSQANKSIGIRLQKENQNRQQTSLPPDKETDAAVLRGLEQLPELGMKQPVLRMGAADKAPSFLLIGDSHSQRLYRPLHAACTEAGVRGILLNNSITPCCNLLLEQIPVDPSCWNERVASTLKNYLRQHPEITHVLISLYWEMRLKVTHGKDARTGREFLTEEKAMAVTGPGLGEFCDELRALGKEVILLGDNPTFDAPAPLDVWQRCQQFGVAYQGRHITREEHERKQAFSHQLLRQLESEGRAQVIDLATPLLIEGVYPDRLNGKFLYNDVNHLSELGSQRAVDYLMPYLLESLRAAAAK